MELKRGIRAISIEKIIRKAAKNKNWPNEKSLKFLVDSKAIMGEILRARKTPKP
jgi:hypothetical protein